jgi:outer membrane protein assembly factor BamE (lipoprotein component of BamABCDE complex)
MNKIKKFAFSCLTLATLSACAPVVAQRGNMLEDHQLQQITAGTSTKSDVLRTLGSPTTQSTFNPDIWYYIGQTVEKRGILDPQVAEERVVIVSFNAEGIVQDFHDAEGERQDIPYARTKTPTHGNELTFTQQLLGNMGKFNTPQSSPTDLGR